VSQAQTLVVILTWASFIVTGAILAKWDFREHRLPNVYVIVAFFGGLVGFAAVSVLGHPWESFLRAVIAAVVCVFVFAIIHVLGGMGLGDVKYAGVIGLYLGWISWHSVYWGVFGSFIFATMYVAYRAIRQRPARNIPFGPFMSLGVIVTSAISVA
jgi:leader peptidase (prepilin peptidase) / N-methyltransferase